VVLISLIEIVVLISLSAILFIHWVYKIVKSIFIA
jgi:hypothetical protein